MTAYNGTVSQPLVGGDLGDVALGYGHFTTTGNLALNDTITFSGIAKNPYDALQVEVYGDELDSNGTPTLTFDVGTSDDTDGFIDGANGGGDALARLNVSSPNNAALIGTTVSNGDLILTVAANPATGVGAGKVINVKVTGKGK